MTGSNPSITFVDLSATEDWQTALLDIARTDRAIWEALARYLAVSIVVGRIADIWMDNPVDLATVLDAVQSLPDDLRPPIASEVDELRAIGDQHKTLISDCVAVYLEIRRKLWGVCVGPQYDYIATLLRGVMASKSFTPESGDIAGLLARMSAIPTPIDVAGDTPTASEFVYEPTFDASAAGPVVHPEVADVAALGALPYDLETLNKLEKREYIALLMTLGLGKVTAEIMYMSRGDASGPLTIDDLETVVGPRKGLASGAPLTIDDLEIKVNPSERLATVPTADASADDLVVELEDVDTGRFVDALAAASAAGPVDLADVAGPVVHPEVADVAALGAHVRRLQWTVGVVASCALVIMGLFGFMAVQADDKAQEATIEAIEARQAARASEKRANAPVRISVDNQTWGVWDRTTTTTIQIGGHQVTMEAMK